MENASGSGGGNIARAGIADAATLWGVDFFVAQFVHHCVDHS